MVKNPPANAGDIRDTGLIPGLEMATHSSILAWRIPWTEEPDRVQSMGLQRVRHDSMTFTFMSKNDTESQSYTFEKNELKTD